MTPNELDTAAREDIPLIVVVMNDCAYGAERHYLELEHMPIARAVFPDVDYAPVAEAFGFRTATIRSLEDLRRAAPLLQSPDGPVLLDCKINAAIAAPFTPEMAAHQNADERLMHKYGIDEAQLTANRAAIRERAAALGVVIDTGHGSRVWNTFDAHRLLHWAGLQDAEAALRLKRALLRAYFTDNDNVADHGVLIRAATDAKLDVGEARRILESDQYADEVRAQERHFQQAGIHSVPATIIGNGYLIAGGQPPDAFEQALRKVALAQRPIDTR